MSAKEPIPSTSEYQLIKQNSKDTKVLTEQLESELIAAMDQSLKDICLFLFIHSSVLDALSDFIVDKEDISQSELCQWMTICDLLIVHKHLGKNIHTESHSLVLLAARWVVNWPIDRNRLFELFNKAMGEIDTQEKQVQFRSLMQKYTNFRNQLVNANLRLVAHLAGRYRDKGLDTEELIQEGTLGVIQAANRFNASLGNRFTTYAYWWIQQALKQALSDKRGAVRLPTNVTDRIHSINKHTQAYIRQHGHSPTVKQLHGFSGLDIQLLEQFQKIGNLGISLNTPMFEDDGEDKIHGLSNDELPIHNAMNHWSHHKLAKHFVNLLSERQATVIRLYHGIDTRQELTFREIAPVLGITLERTRQIYHEALKILKENLQEDHQLADFFKD